MTLNTLFNPAMFGAKNNNANTDPVGAQGTNLALELENEELKLEAKLQLLDNSMALLAQLDHQIELGERFETKGLSADAVQFFVETTDAIRVQFNVPVEITASMESFAGTTTDSVEALGMSLKSMRNVASEAWDAVIKMLKDLYEAGAVFLTKLFDVMPSLKKKAEALKEKAGNTEGTPENSKFKFSGLTNIANENKDFVIGDVVTNLPKLFSANALENLVKLGSSDKIKALDDTAEKVAAMKADDLGLDNAAFDALHDGLSDVTGENIAKLGRDGDVIKGIADLPGAKAFAIAVPSAPQGDGAEAALKRLAGVKFDIRTMATDPKLDKDREITVLTITQVEQICDVIEKGCESFEKSKGGIEAGRKAVSELTKLAEKLKDNAGKTDYKEVKGTLNAAKSAIQRSANLAGEPTRKLASYFNSVGNSLIALGEASLKQYKK